MLDSRTSRGHLNISALHSLDIAHAVFVAQFARDDVGEDFEFSVRVSWKASARLDPVSMAASEQEKTNGYSVLIDDS